MVGRRSRSVPVLCPVFVRFTFVSGVSTKGELVSTMLGVLVSYRERSGSVYSFLLLHKPSSASGFSYSSDSAFVSPYLALRASVSVFVSQRVSVHNFSLVLK